MSLMTDTDRGRASRDSQAGRTVRSALALCSLARGTEEVVNDELKLESGRLRKSREGFRAACYTRWVCANTDGNS